MSCGCYQHRSGSLPELIEAKHRGMQDVVARLSHSEDFAQLASAASEDEATKNRGGDLGFFSADRTPPEFFLAVGEVIGEFIARICTIASWISCCPSSGSSSDPRHDIR